MSDKSEKEAKPKKKGGGMMMKIIMAVGLLGAGGGGVFGLVAAGVIGGGHAEEKKDNSPKLIRKGEVDPYAPKAKEGEEGGAEVDGEGGSEFRTVYYNFAEDFTSNLKNTDALLQVNISASTRRDYRVVSWMKKHELAIRSALLIAIADTPEEDVISPEGKARLQKRLTAEINRVLTETEGFGGVDNVYFKSFIVQ
ncbi:MAG: flagellar basal body-associated protein FliL [Novosphingobium meiothermophilum]|uniref:flagellar basal body-associated FliL family protein n=1 Tax=Novosphingobium TaxID=165696 RepID=UPI000D6E88C2|nr:MULTISPECIES: flagellar basal body-associated FliL family protein [Novosphingobium]